ncbi:hypothetical protein SSYIS1_00340 [Serratia symbiotica]|uniref:Uncharacterized protein n=1 Tax=Serratia symbiotica TaxID=138074 RepID=A0A455VPR1_9GAMM|nr:hypothetical protein SSYIS1_00340 [Serratia symbiotica]
MIWCVRLGRIQDNASWRGSPSCSRLRPVLLVIMHKCCKRKGNAVLTVNEK